MQCPNPPVSRVSTQIPTSLVRSILTHSHSGNLHASVAVFANINFIVNSHRKMLHTFRSVRLSYTYIHHIMKPCPWTLYVRWLQSQWYLHINIPYIRARQPKTVVSALAFKILWIVIPLSRQCFILIWFSPFILLLLLLWVSTIFGFWLFIRGWWMVSFSGWAMFKNGLGVIYFQTCFPFSPCGCVKGRGRRPCQMWFW